MTAPASKRKLRIGVVDLTTRGQTTNYYYRTVNPNAANIMPQAVARWCEEEGHEVFFLCYTGEQDIAASLPDDMDIVFISAFTQAALLSYALSSFFRSRGAVTMLGGPHARCYPQDARRYFDYVFGFTDKSAIRDVLRDCTHYRPFGEYVSARKQPDSLPGLRERWKFIEKAHLKTTLTKSVPMVSSLGCPYSCGFCVDASVPYQPMDQDRLRDDFRFLRKKLDKPLISWHDPNFGVRFNRLMDIMEDAVPPGSVRFIAESSISFLTEERLRRLKRNGCKGIFTGTESWYDMGDKVSAAALTGLEKVRHVSSRLNLASNYIPYTNTSLIMGLDTDRGSEPFELSKRFVDMTPGVAHNFILLNAFGRAAPFNERYFQEERIVPFPFHFLGNKLATNVKPKHYSWTEYYDRLIDLTAHTFAWKRIMKRFFSAKGGVAGVFCIVQGVAQRSSIRHFAQIRHLLESDSDFRLFFEGRTIKIHPFFTEIVRRELGEFWAWLPEGAICHDPETASRLAEPDCVEAASC